MTRITVDAALADQLKALAEVVELCDPSGHPLGQFLRAVDLSQWEPVSPAVSEEELDRRERSQEWYTTEEVLAHLKGLEQP